MRKAWTAALTVLAMLTGALVGATPAGAAGVALPFSQYAAMLVDESHGHLFFSAGAGADNVWVTDLSGHLVTTLSSLAGATGLAMSPDGSAVYVAEVSGNAISAIDTSTLAVSSVLSDIQCPTWLAYTGGKLWYSYGCANDAGAVAGFDPAVTPITTTALPPDQITYSSPPRLSGGGPNATVLVVTHGTHLSGYDVATMTRIGGNDTYCQGSYGSVTVTPDGATVAVVCGNSPVTVARTSDFSQLGVYANGQGYTAHGVVDPMSATFTADGQFLAVGISTQTPNILVYPLGDTSAPNDTLNTNNELSELVPDDMRYGPSNDLYVVVPTSHPATTFALVVLHDTTRYPSTTTLAGPASATRAEPLSLTGHISGPGPSIAGGQAISVTRADLSGTRLIGSTTTGADGSFDFVDSPPVGGVVTYTAAWVGDAAHRSSSSSVKVSVSRVIPSISITTNARTYAYGAKATVTAHLGTTYNSRTVSIYAVPYASSKRTLKTGTVDSHGNLTIVVPVYWRLSFGASFAGDYRYAPTAVSRPVDVVGKLTLKVLNAYGRSGIYALYHHGANVPHQAQLLPKWTNLCIAFRAERYYSGAWHTVARACSLTYAGAAALIFTGTNPAGAIYRSRAEWGGKEVVAATTSPWVYFRFT